MKRNPKAGRGACPCCGESVFYRRTASGKLTVSCDACDFSAFAEAGGRADRKLSAGLTPCDDDDAPAPAPAPAPAAKPAAKPEGSGARVRKPAAPASAFTLAGLT